MGAAEILPQAVDAAGSASSFGEGGKRSFFPLGLSSTAILDTGGVGRLSTERTAVWTSGIGMELNAAGRKETDKARGQTNSRWPDSATDEVRWASSRKVGASCRHSCITITTLRITLPCLPSRGAILPIRLLALEFEFAEVLA
ncbi:hypothetical protein TgHK011_006613 [Trichoderma gracile]|nr:hypothetical protein TgHK011_006613 [Trichoderma gracile]